MLFQSITLIASAPLCVAHPTLCAQLDDFVDIPLPEDYNGQPERVLALRNSTDAHQVVAVTARNGLVAWAHTRTCAQVILRSAAIIKPWSHVAGVGLLLSLGCLASWEEFFRVAHAASHPRTPQPIECLASNAGDEALSKWLVRKALSWRSSLLCFLAPWRNTALYLTILFSSPRPHTGHSTLLWLRPRFLRACPAEASSSSSHFTRAASVTPSRNGLPAPQTESAPPRPLAPPNVRTASEQSRGSLWRGAHMCDAAARAMPSLNVRRC